MSPCDLLVIGGGPAGLVAAVGAATLGARVTLVERHALGGDCLHAGCIPSKTLRRSAASAHASRTAGGFGVRTGGVTVDGQAVMARVRAVRDAVGAQDSPERLASLGVHLLTGTARFVDRDAVEVDGHRVRFRRAILATGARPALPAIPGLDGVAHHTTATVFDIDQLPRRLLVVGGGPAGCELAQAFQRLGVQVTLVEQGARLLAAADAEASAVVADALRADGVDLHPDTTVRELTATPTGTRATLVRGEAGPGTACEVDAVLLATGRVPQTDGLALEAAGIETDGQAPLVDARLRTTNRRVYAAGDVCLPQRFTHAADASARLALRNALFGGRARWQPQRVPWCVYTAPEVAQAGLTREGAARDGVAVDAHTRQWRDVDRARADGVSQGFVRLLTRRGSDRLVGATIVGPHAGDLIGQVVVAMHAGLGLRGFSQLIQPYPGYSEAFRQLGDGWQRGRLTPLVRGALGQWLAWSRRTP